MSAAPPADRASRWWSYGPRALCRLDDALVERVRDGRSLRPLLAGAAVTVLVGGALYGAALGAWRAPEQALYSAIKLPLLMGGVGAATLLINAILAALLRARLSLTQTAACVLVSLGVTCAVLGALAPVTLFIVANTPPPDPSATRLDYGSSYVMPSMEIAQTLLLWNVAVVAGAGLVGVVRLHGLLRRIVDDALVVRRVLFAWLLAQGLVGAELSWLLRPFLGKPHLPPTFIRAEAFDGNFFEEVGRLLGRVFGAAGVPLALVALSVLALWLFLALRAAPDAARGWVSEAGLHLPERVVPFGSVRSARAHVGGWLDVSTHVLVELAPDEALEVETIRLACDDAGSARALAAQIETLRAQVPEGPFRTLAWSAPPGGEP